MDHHRFEIEGLREVELVRRVYKCPRVVGELRDHAAEQQARPGPGHAQGWRRRPAKPVQQCQHSIDIQAPVTEAVGVRCHLTVTGQSENRVFAGRFQPRVHENQVSGWPPLPASIPPVGIWSGRNRISAENPA